MKQIKVAAAIIIEQNQILATQRGAGQWQGGWEFPGGKIEPRETSEEAVKREVWEELGVKIKVITLFETVEYDYPEFHLTMDCFICRIKSGKPVLKEHLQARWLSQPELSTVAWLPADIALIERLKAADIRQM